MKKISAVLLDGDDTLWKTQEIYEEVKEQFASLLKNIGINDKNIIEKLDNLDMQRVPFRGFTIERFLESMVLTYTILSTTHGLPWQSDIEENIYRIGELLKRPPKLYEDTLSALNMLKPKAKLYLYTAGKRSIQMQKINKVGIIKYFNGIYVVQSKNKAVLKRIMREIGVNPEATWLIGNSLRSDVMPAVDAGINAILIERGVWKYDNHNIEKEKHTHHFHAHSLNEAASTILE